MTPHSYKRADTIHVIAVWLARYIRLSMDTADTHKASTCVTKRWTFIRHFMEVMRVFEVEAQLGTYRHSPHEVRVDFLTADLSFSGQKMFQSATQQWVSQVEGFRNHSTAHVVSCFFSVLQPQQHERPLSTAASSPVSFVSAEGKGEVGCYFLKVLQWNVAILILVVIFHHGLQGATEQSDIQLRLLRSSWLVLL